jgi:hypothetical protein
MSGKNSKSDVLSPATAAEIERLQSDNRRLEAEIRESERLLEAAEKSKAGKK